MFNVRLKLWQLVTVSATDTVHLVELGKTTVGTLHCCACVGPPGLCLGAAVQQLMLVEMTKPVK
jgi:hypothetical protein